MHELLESIRSAVAEGATGDQKAAGAQACRTILAALEAEAGKPLTAASAPPTNPLAGIDPNQALDLLIARLRAALPTEGGEGVAAKVDQRSGLRLTFVRPPAGAARRSR